MQLVADFLFFIYLSGIVFYAPRVFWTGYDQVGIGSSGFTILGLIVACVILTISWPLYAYIEWDVKRQ